MTTTELVKDTIELLNRLNEMLDKEEREEEKKYCLIFPKEFVNFRCLMVFTKDNTYKTQFTQKEIDEMPFDTSVFTKEEVK